MATPRVGFYGGGFNPPHVAHVMTAAWALQFGRLDKLIVTPCFHHAWDKDSGLLWHGDRVDLARAAFDGMRNVLVSTIEADTQATHTFYVLEALKKNAPDTQFVLVVGSDNVRDWDKWHRHDEIDQMVEKLVVPRPGSTNSPWAMPDVSSTAVRTWIAAGEWDKVGATVPPKVVEMIRAKGFFQKS